MSNQEVSHIQLANELRLNKRQISRLFRSHVFYNENSNPYIVKTIITSLQTNLIHIMNERDTGVKLELLRRSGFKHFSKKWSGSYRCGDYDINYVSKIINKRYKDDFNNKLLYFFNKISRFIYMKYN